MVTKKTVSTKSKGTPVQVWYGSNQSLLQLELARWREEFRKRHPQALVTRLEYESKNEDDLLRQVHQAASGGGLFAQARLLVLEGFIKAEAKGELARLLKTLLENTPAGTFIIIIEGAKLSAKGLVSAVRDLAKEEKITLREFIDLSLQETEKWLLARAKAGNGKLPVQVARLLVAQVGNDFYRLDQEVAKLVAYRGQAEIRVSDLDLLVSGQVPEDVFALVESIGRRDFVKAHKVLEQQFSLGVSPQSLVGLLGWHLRVLTGIRLALDEGGAKLSARELAQQLGFHPFVVSRALQQIPYYSTERLAWLYRELSDLDVRLKQASVDPSVLFSAFLGKLATLRLGK
ncbi:MAG: DNA polymerase III subunit delta [Candidatus Kerfeldbacteria bacterium]|nr:DNA polymerase III subunit delta [Candidatus Kerfeldbacteria bacterium]